ncbi:uncharacterized protein H6S33_011374 [Morchella sextelata]|uniref:uncharacterized protein n=1 Tax=Morchella sextelata TaxID=1174677 RepID=UPI001D04E8E3|nr:uncharacterized protein H6S33_009796 [Morchella sextelata]XP_044696142.1 uncharacterized protein H6S33_011374 [Morchella sextelata]KAH0602345.1 hypothetical protein H6S33_009796 [Morchella sextelata]KAH0610947.1 hypothetical protein H6S33_011374 [Morchella sextelata]
MEIRQEEAKQTKPAMETEEEGFQKWWCEAKILSNPDISGIGVISAFFVQGFLASLIGICMYYFSGRWNRLITFPPLAYKYLRAGGHLGGLPTLPRSLHPANPLRAAMMTDIILLTSDMQTLSGIALMVASLSQFPKLSAYHAIMVGNMAWIPSLSHHLAIMYVWDEKPYGRFNIVRYAAVALYAVLYAVYCGLTYTSVRRRWDLEQDCFRACSAKYCVGSYTERDSLLGWVLVNLVFFVCGYLPTICGIFVKMFVKGSWPWMRLAGDLVFSAALCLPVMIFWTVFTLCGVLGYRKANRELLSEDAEERWGFGQVVAVVSLLLVVFEFWKSYVKYNETSPEEDPALCKCTCFCGKRVDSFSTVESGGMVSVNF